MVVGGLDLERLDLGFWLERRRCQVLMRASKNIATPMTIAMVASAERDLVVDGIFKEEGPGVLEEV